MSVRTKIKASIEQIAFDLMDNKLSLSRLENNKSHTSTHVDTNMLSTLLENNKYAHAVFNDDATGDYSSKDEYVNSLIGNALYESAEYIAHELSMSDNGVTTTIDCVFRDEKLGTGIYKKSPTNSHLSAVDTDTIRIVLQRDFSMPEEFSILTAYPLIAANELHLTNNKDMPSITANAEIDLNNLIKKTDIYKSASATKRLYLDAITNPNKESICDNMYYNENTDTIMKRIAPCKNHKASGITECRAFINGDPPTPKIKLTKDHRETRILYTDFKTAYPKTSRQIDALVGFTSLKPDRELPTQSKTASHQKENNHGFDSP